MWAKNVAKFVDEFFDTLAWRAVSRPIWISSLIFVVLLFVVAEAMVSLDVPIKEILCKSKKKSKVYYLIPRKYSTFWRSILMRLYSPVDLTGNVNMIEKLVLGGTGTGDLPILSPTR